LKEEDQMKFLMATTITLMTFAWGPAQANDPANNIIEKARQCFAKDTLSLNQPISVTFDLVFRRNGLVDLVQTVEIRPDTPETRIIAADMGASFVHCGPYVINGAGKITLTVRWPPGENAGATAQ
jgi:hypothetical protein